MPSESPSTGSPSPPASSNGGGSQVDIKALADRVYRLMVSEARLDRARGVMRSGE
jgi:hypothetical protein